MGLKNICYQASAAPPKIVPESEIAALKVAGKVWVNIDPVCFATVANGIGARLEDQDAIKSSLLCSQDQ